MARYTDAQLVTICRQELGRTAGSSLDDGNLTQNRREAIEYYLAREPAGPSVPGRSQVVSPDVRNVITNLSAEMTNLWAGEYPAEFEVEGPEDEQQAQLETYAVQQVLERCDLDRVLADACFDALLLKNGIVKVWVDDEVSRETRVLEDASAQEIAAFMAQLPEDAVVSTSGNTATITVPTTRRKVCVEAIDPTNFLISQATRSLDVEQARFVAERKFITRSDLIAMGYSKAKVERLQAFSYDTKEDSYTRRLDYTTADESAETRDQDRCEVFESYLMIDMNHGGMESDRWRIVFSDEEILEKTRVNYVPYCTGTILTFPHRWSGISAFDLSKESQDIGTAATRQYLDNNATAIQNRLVVGPGINSEDLEAAGPNRHVRMTRGDDVRSQAMPLPYADIGPSIMGLIEYKNQLRSEATGAAIEMHGGEHQLMNSQIGSMGADRVMTAQEQISALFLRNFSTSLIKGLFLLVHRVLREDYAQPLMLRAGDNWQQQDPRMWGPRHAVAVRTGMSTGERNRKVGALTTHLQVQMQLMQSGSPMVDQNAIYQLLQDLARAQELESAAEYYVDPSSEQFAQSAQQMQQSQQQQQEMQMQLQAMPEQVKVQIQAMKDEIDKLKIAADLEMKEAELVGTATKELSLAQIQRETAANTANAGGTAGAGQPANGSGTS